MIPNDLNNNNIFTWLYNTVHLVFKKRGEEMIKFYSWYIRELEAQEKSRQADEQGIERYADNDQ